MRVIDFHARWGRAKVGAGGKKAKKEGLAVAQPADAVAEADLVAMLVPDLAQKALAQKGYMVEVAGFADTTGNAALNQDLSQRRAAAVINYLQQQGNIPIHRILAPAGMGTSHEAADNKTSAGRKLNRRVEVKVLVNQGVTGGSATSSSSGASAGSTTSGTPAPTTPRQ